MRNCLIAALFCSLTLVSARAEEPALVVAASANTSHAARKLVEAFEKLTGRRVKLTVAASGTIYSQVANGAPYDVFLSADREYATRLVEAGLGERESLRAFAIGQLAVWSARDSGFTVTPDLKGLLAPGVRKIAVANPTHAPFGEAAIAALQSLGLYDRVRDKLVFGENVAQAFQFVESGAADVGLVSLSLILAPGQRSKGRYSIIPVPDPSSLEQTAVVVKRRGLTGPNPEPFLDFLLSREGQAILKEYGYLAPGERP